MDSNKRRKIDFFQIDNNNNKPVNPFQNFALMNKNDAKNEKFQGRKGFSIDDYSDDIKEEVYDEDDYGENIDDDNFNGNQVLDFGMNKFSNDGNKNVNNDYNQIIDYKYIDFKQFIGNGNFSNVWSATLQCENELDNYEEDSLVAVKVLKTNKEIKIPIDGFLNELEILKKINKDGNENVLKLIAFCQTPQACIITELMDLSLYDLIHQKKDSTYLDDLNNKIDLMLQISKGVFGINEKSGILHNDLTSKNILLKEIHDNKNDKLSKIFDKL